MMWMRRGGVDGTTSRELCLTFSWQDRVSVLDVGVQMHAPDASAALSGEKKQQIRHTVQAPSMSSTFKIQLAQSRILRKTEHLLLRARSPPE